MMATLTYAEYAEARGAAPVRFSVHVIAERAEQRYRMRQEIDYQMRVLLTAAKALARLEAELAEIEAACRDEQAFANDGRVRR